MGNNRPTSIIEALHRLLGIVTPNIDNLISRFSHGNFKGRERPLLEFKASYVPRPDSDDDPDWCRWNVIRAIVGMANSNGGCVVLGLLEDEADKSLKRGNGDPDNILAMPGLEDKDLAEHTRKELFRKKDVFQIGDTKIRIDKDFWKRLSEQTNGVNGFVTCRSYADGSRDGFPVVAIFVEPLPAGQELISVKIEKSKKDGVEHSEVYCVRDENKAETSNKIRRKWVTKQCAASYGITDGNSEDAQPVENFDDEYTSFKMKRNPELTLELLNDELFTVKVEEVFSSVDHPLARHFVGRDEKLAELHNLLESSRIPVIFGPGGMGKTELALQYAERHKSDYPGGLFQINMESVPNWDIAFCQLVNNSEVCEILGVKGTQASAEEVRLALCHRAEKKGRILLVLDNIESISTFLRQSDLDKLALSPKICAIATARSSDIAFGGHDRACLLELKKLEQDEAVEFLLSNRPARSQTEHQAATNIAMLLDCRPLYLRKIPALLDKRFSPLAGSYARLEKALRDNLPETISVAMKDACDEERTPLALWNLTRKYWLQYPQGVAWVKIAHIASFFTPEGFRRATLQHLWGTLAAPGADSELDFEQALDILKSHGYLSDTGSELRMHRLTAATLRHSAHETDANLEESIGKSLSGFEGIGPIDWLALAENTNIVKFVPRQLLSTELRLNGGGWDASLQINILLRNPEFQTVVDWSAVNGREWGIILSELPELADRCDWTKLEGWDWRHLLYEQPQFADKCDWSKLDGSDWEQLLCKRPQFAEYSQWGKIDGSGWADILYEQPQLEKYCSLLKFNGRDWANLLSVYPQFADKCPWDTFSTEDWTNLLSEQPQFERRCPWEEFSAGNWVDLLSRSSLFADKCPGEMLEKKLNVDGWIELLDGNPEFANHCPWQKFDGRNWAELLKLQPRFFDKCDWTKLEGWDWCRLLREQPQFADKCDWTKIDGLAWACLIGEQPQFADKCDWSKFDGAAWASLISEQPQFAGKVNECDWTKFDGHAWSCLLSKQPQFANKLGPRDWRKLDGYAWSLLLREQPQLANRCPWEKLDAEDWATLLQRAPQFSEQCDWDKLDGTAWGRILDCHPQFADHCPFEKLSEGDWWDLLYETRKFVDRCLLPKERLDYILSKLDEISKERAANFAKKMAKLDF